MAYLFLSLFARDGALPSVACGIDRVGTEDVESSVALRVYVSIIQAALHRGHAPLQFRSRR